MAEEHASDRQELMAAIASIARVQGAELFHALAAEQTERGFRGVPNAMQLIYQDDRIEFAYGGDVSLPVCLDGEEKTLTGTDLLGTLAGKSAISLPTHSPFSHFTFIRGGEVSLNGAIVPHIRNVLAWDLHGVLSYLAASPEPLPYPHKLANRFQEFHVRKIIERLGVRRGPQGRRERMGGMAHNASERAGEDYLDEISGSTTLETASEKFWKGVSPAVPPWRFLKVHGQPADFTHHGGRDTLPGHLADRLLTDMLHRYDMVIQRRDGEEPIFSETELVQWAMVGAEQWGANGSDIESGFDILPGRGDAPESVTIAHDILDKLRPIPGFAAWHMSKVEDKTQEEVAGALNRSQGRVSQLIKDFKEQARPLIEDYLKQAD